MSERPSTRAPPSVASSSASRAVGRKQSHWQRREQHRLAGLEQDVRGVIAGRSVDPETDLHASSQIFLDRRDAGSETHIRARTMRRTAAGLGELFNLIIIDMDRMREPHIVT